jgi:hypothetical protein
MHLFPKLFALRRHCRAAAVVGFDAAVIDIAALPGVNAMPVPAADP